jgi:FkbH-like protein
MSPPIDALTLLHDADDRKVASAISAVRVIEAADLAWRARARVRVLRNITLEPLGPPLKLAAFRRGIALDLSFSDHGAYPQEILDPDSHLAKNGADLVFLALWLEELPLSVNSAGELDAERVIEHVTGLVGQLLGRFGGKVALTTFVPPLRRVATRRDDAALARINLAVLALAERHERVLVVDLRRLVERLGEARALDARGALLHRAPFSPELSALLAEWLADAIAAAHGAQRKVLALDCDGTLWGGVLGEDGPEGIRLSPDDYPGSAYLAFQEQILALQRAGVMIVLVSKNEEADVLDVLARHPHGRLRPEHLAGHRVNWASKADNLRALAEELRVDLSSFVFVDDSPHECALVRRELPMVDVRRVPEHACHLPALLRDAAATFGVGAVTGEDQLRTRAIQAEKQRADAARSATDLEGFLRSLDLSVEIGPPAPSSVARVAQLTQRTNQWNLTTRRYEADAVRELCAREDALVLGMRAADRFGDYGLVGVSIAVREEGRARIDSLLLSCRALGRRLEDALLAETLREVEARWGRVPVAGEYLATAKNAQVEGFFDAHGFACVAASAARRLYEATAEAARTAPDLVTVHRREST